MKHSGYIPCKSEFQIKIKFTVSLNNEKMFSKHFNNSKSEILSHKAAILKKNGTQDVQHSQWFSSKNIYKNTKPVNSIGNNEKRTL
jgi:hypothetical protein